MYRFLSPFGVIDYAWHDGVCHRITLQTSNMRYEQHDDPISAWLSAYFLGEVRALPALAPGKTNFQDRLRHALSGIPYGEVKCYGELAKTLNTAPRALGQALGANAFPIVVPCHRVVAVKGLGGFHYGAEWKKALLDFELGKQKNV